jgi:hypothetical protein
MARYEKVTFLDRGRKRSVFLRIERDGARYLHGTEVDKCADEIEGADFTERLRIIDKSFVTSRRHYVLDHHYGELVPVKKATQRQ